MNRNNELMDVIDKHFRSSVGEMDSLGDWLHAAGKGSEAFLYSALFMPELVQLGGSVLLEWNLPDKDSKKRFLEAIAEGKEPREEIESSFNFVEIHYLFADRDISEEEIDLLAEIVRDAWDGWLKVSYPDRRFKVEVLPEEVDGITVSVHFFEVR